MTIVGWTFVCIPPPVLFDVTLIEFTPTAVLLFALLGELDHVDGRAVSPSQGRLMGPRFVITDRS